MSVCYILNTCCLYHELHPQVSTFYRHLQPSSQIVQNQLKNEIKLKCGHILFSTFKAFLFFKNCTHKIIQPIVVKHLLVLCKQLQAVLDCIFFNFEQYVFL